MSSTGQTPAAAPEVSVLLLCYNHRPFVEACLASVAAQTLNDFELIVCDDASSDGSADCIAQALAVLARPARYVRHASNRGLCPSLVELMALAQGRFIAMIAADDLWEPDRLQLQLALLSQHPEAAMVYSDAHQIDEHGQRLPLSVMEAHHAPVPPPSGKLFNTLADGNFIPAMATLIRREAIDAVGGYDASLSYEDYDMWLRLAERYPILHLPGRLASYRIVESSMVRTLFQRPSAAHYDTLFRICERWLRRDLLSPEQRRRWVRRQADAAYGLFFCGHGRARQALWTVARRDRKRRWRWLLIGGLCAIGLHRPRLMGLARRLRRSHRE